jgi:GAF domain-containing protein
MQCPRCQQENPSSQKYCGECGTPLSRSNETGSYVELEHAQREALEQQTATSEILQVISRSPTDVQPVYDSIVKRAVRLCGGLFSTVILADSNMIRLGACYGFEGAARETIEQAFPAGLESDLPSAWVIRERSVLHLPDTEDSPYARWARQAGFRSYVSLPMLKGNSAIGAIAVARTERGLFSDQHVELLKTFADQAVIAIENVRLFNETKEALERQTATSEILGVISSSPTDLQPVFEAILRSAQRLLGARTTSVLRRLGDEVHLAAFTSTGEAGDAAYTSLFPMLLDDYRERFPFAMRDWVTGTVTHVPDAELDTRLPEIARGLARARGFRSVLQVPMRREGQVIGVLGITRRETGAFADAEIALAQTFADQAAIGVENVRLFTELEARNRDLTATSEILRVIASSPTELQPVFDTIAERSMRLCEATFGWVLTFDGALLHLRSLANMNPEGADALREAFPMAPSRGIAAGRAILTGNVVHLPDIWADPEYEFKAIAREKHFRSSLAVPLLHRGRPIGAIAVSRPNPGVYSDAGIEQLKTFADQAVIAIENGRLFKELEARNKDLTVALEQQTTTSEILRVISQSPTDVQPVFEAIAESAARLCEAPDVSIFVREVDHLRVAARHGSIPSDTALPLSRESGVGWAVLTGRTIHIADMQTELERFPVSVQNAQRLGFRTALNVPLMREGVAIGAISLRRAETHPFSERQVALLETFADQTVIAIENVRLFRELEARNRDLTEALEQQTATSEILRVISRSQTDVQPVFDTIVASAVRLLGAYASVLTRIAGDQIEFAAHTSTDDTGDAPVRAAFPQSRHSEWPAAQAIRDRAPINIADAHTDPRVPETLHALARVRGYRSLVVVPLLRHDEAVGAIAVSRREPGGFTDDEIALLQTFADQAVIAIENVRLFKELEARTAELTRSVGELTALGEVSQALSSTLDLEAVLDTIVSRASQLAGAAGCSIYEYDGAAEQFELRATHNPDARFVEALRAAPLRRGEGVMGRATEMREPIQIPDIAQPGAYQSSVRDILLRFGYRALLSVPLLREDQIIGSLSFNRKAPGEFAPEVVDVLKTFATQSALAIQNARLFHEIADKSRQLEAASQHKSEFLANMSHELRTPLNAILGFSEVLAQGMFGDVNEKQSEYLNDILESGRHLLSLINDILDLSKIEAGRMELEASEFDLPQAIQNALTLVRERALRRGIALHHVIDDRVADVRADERKVKQVLLNLLSNAIKFTPEGGRIDIRAAPADGLVEVSVTDTGVGIAPEDQEAVFEEFRQVGTADKKAEGTGLGLALSRKFIELHGGRIWVTSQVGVGSTFTFTLPSARGSSEVRDAGTDR